MTVPEGFSEAEMEGFLNAQGWGRIHRREGDELEVIQDRTRLSSDNRDRLVEALEQAFRHGQGHLRVYPLNAEHEPEEPLRFSTELHCPDCDIGYRQPIPNSFSFNSPMGACDTCRGFGRVIGVDWSLVVPDESKSIADGAIKPFQSESGAECQADIRRYAKQKGVPTDVPWSELTEEQRQWAIEGEGKPNGRRWYGIRGYFDYLESKAYKMDIRVLLSK